MGASIPLPALGIKPVEQPDLMQQFGQMQALKNQQVRGQSEQLQLQQQQRAMKDQDILTKSYMDSQGDLDKTALLAAQRGASPQSVIGVRQSAMESRAKMASMQKDQLANVQKTSEIVANGSNALLQLAPEQRPQALQEMMQGFVQQQVVPPDQAQQIMQSAPMDDPQKLETWLKVHGLAAMDAAKQADAYKNKQEGDKAAAGIPGAQAETQMKQQQAAMTPTQRSLQGNLAYQAAGGDPQAKAAMELETQQKKASRPVVNNQVSNTDAKDIADAIESGDQPPTLTGLYRNAAPVRAELARRSVPIAKMEMDWNATKKFTSTLNSSQQVRLRQDIVTVSDSLDKVEGLYNEWKKLAPQSGFKVLNKATLAAMKQAPGRAGAVATALDAQIADTTAGLGTIYMGGNSPTDHSLDLAKKSLSSDWNDQTFTEGLKQARANVKIRQNSILHAAPAGTSDGNTYASQQNAAPPAASGGTIFARDPQGKLHQAPAGTALPAGWKQENR
jgi:hypothetical protein